MVRGLISLLMNFLPQSVAIALLCAVCIGFLVFLFHGWKKRSSRRSRSGTVPASSSTRRNVSRRSRRKHKSVRFLCTPVKPRGVLTDFGERILIFL